MLVVVTIAIIGGGRFSLDAKMAGNNSRSGQNLVRN
jgi:hypothetical protein